MKTKLEVYGVYDEDDYGLGYIARRVNVFGVHDFGAYWCVTVSLVDPIWMGAFEDISEAKQYLKGLRSNPPIKKQDNKEEE